MRGRIPVCSPLVQSADLPVEEGVVERVVARLKAAFAAGQTGKRPLPTLQPTASAPLLIILPPQDEAKVRPLCSATGCESSLDGYSTV